MTDRMKEALNELSEAGRADLYMELLRSRDFKEPAFAEAALKHRI